MAGRPPKPLAIREKEKTLRTRHREKMVKSPKLPVVQVENIEGLSENAQKHWPRIKQVLGIIQCTTAADVLAVERLCETYAEIREYQKTLKEEGRFYESSTKTGTIMRAHPAMQALQDADRRFHSYLTDFGLTPAARSKVSGGPQEENHDPLEEFGI